MLVENLGARGINSCVQLCQKFTFLLFNVLKHLGQFVDTTFQPGLLKFFTNLDILFGLETFIMLYIFSCFGMVWVQRNDFVWILAAHSLLIRRIQWVLRVNFFQIFCEKQRRNISAGKCYIVLLIICWLRLLLTVHKVVNFRRICPIIACSLVWPSKRSHHHWAMWVFSYFWKFKMVHLVQFVVYVSNIFNY